MTHVRITVVFLLSVLTMLTTVVAAQESPATLHARRVMDSLRQEKFDDVAQEFDAKVAALMSASRLREVWATLQNQAGAFPDRVKLSNRQTSPIRDAP